MYALQQLKAMQNNPLKALMDARGSGLLPWLRPPPAMQPPISSSTEDMAKFLNIHSSLLQAVGHHKQSSENLPNFGTTNKDHLLPPPPSLTRSSTPNTNEPCSPPPTLMPPPYQLGGSSNASSDNSRRINLLSSGRIPKSDPMEGQLQDMLHYNMERCAGKTTSLKPHDFSFPFFKRPSA